MPKKLHPSVIKFKEFVRNNPQLIKEVRNGKATWQELYEDWYLLGEDDQRFKSIVETNSSKPDKGAEEKGDWVSTILGTLQHMDPNQIQHYISNVSQALGAIQGVISEFQGGNKHPGHSSQKLEQKHPFLFRKD